MITKAYFRQIQATILNALAEAQSSLRISMAWFTNLELFEAVKACKQRGVDVELMILDDAINWQPYAPDFNELIQLQIPIYIEDPSCKFLHNKFCIIDRKTVLTGSYNWTYYAEVRNLENIVEIHDPAICEAYASEFEQLKKHCKQTSTCKRLDWKDLDFDLDVDIRELNKEIESISIIRQLPKREVIKTTTRVELVEKERITKSGVSVGLLVSTPQRGNSFLTLIAQDTTLPLPNRAPLTVYNYSDMREDVRLQLYLGNIEDAEHLLVDEPLEQIVGGSKLDELTIKIGASLDTDGHLKVTVKCIETDKTMLISATNPHLVRHEY